MKSFIFPIAIALAAHSQASLQGDVDVKKVTYSFEDEDMSSIRFSTEKVKFKTLQFAAFKEPSLVFYKANPLFFVKPMSNGSLSITNCEVLDACTQDVRIGDIEKTMRSLPRILLQVDTKFEVSKMVGHFCKGLTPNSDLVFSILPEGQGLPNELAIEIGEQVKVDNVTLSNNPVFAVKNRVTGQTGKMHIGQNFREVFKFVKNSSGQCADVSGFDDFNMTIMTDDNNNKIEFACEAKWQDQYEPCLDF